MFENHPIFAAGKLNSTVLKSHFIPNIKSQVTAVNKYDPPMEVVAARDHITQLVYQLMQPQVVYDRWVS